MTEGERNCSRKGCKKAARWQIGIRLYGAPKGTLGTSPAEGLYSFYVCDEHKKDTTQKEIVNAAAFAYLCEAFKKVGKVSPIKEETEIFFKELP